MEIEKIVSFFIHFFTKNYFFREKNESLQKIFYKTQHTTRHVVIE